MSKDLIRVETGKRVYQYAQDHHTAAEIMLDLVRSVAPCTKQPNLNDWANTLRVMEQQDKLVLREIGEVFRWANKHDFWATNILSPKALRKNFARLHAQMLQDKRKPSGIHGQTQLQRLTDDSWAK